MGIKARVILIVPLVIVTVITGLGAVGFLIGMGVGLPLRLGLPTPVRLLGGIVLLSGFAALGWVFSYGIHGL